MMKPGSITALFLSTCPKCGFTLFRNPTHCRGCGMRFERQRAEEQRNRPAEAVAVAALLVVVLSSLVLMYQLYQAVAEAFAQLY
jgi:uncharacterized protein (DUF983 family)